MDTKELLKKRRNLKRKKPEFIRQDAHRKKKLGWKWRKPKGSDSKMRVSKKGKKRSVRVGWSSPSAVRGTDRSGLLPVTVNSSKDLLAIDPKKETALLSSGLGAKKRMALVEQAVKSNIMITNCKNPEAFLKDMKEKFEKKKQEKKKLKEDRDKKKEAAKKEAAKKKEKEAKEKKEAEKDEDKTTEEEKKMEEKKEKDKLLISTQ